MNFAVVIVSVVLCMAGLANSQIAGADCGADDKCDDLLVCQDTKCRAKIGGTCLNAGNAEECVRTALVCPASGALTCACADTKVANSLNTGCVSKAGGVCTTDGATATQCIPHSTCTTAGEAKQCKCDSMTLPNVNKDKCLMYIGQPCPSGTSCVTNGVCNGGTCTCSDPYKASDSNNTCNIPVGVTCTAPTDCGINAECTSGSTRKCACKTDYFNNNGRCGMKVEGTCTSVADCVLNTECTNSKCACKTDYTVNSDKLCIKSGAQGLLASLALLVAAFLGSRLY